MEINDLFRKIEKALQNKNKIQIKLKNNGMIFLKLAF